MHDNQSGVALNRTLLIENPVDFLEPILRFSQGIRLEIGKEALSVTNLCEPATVFRCVVFRLCSIFRTLGCTLLVDSISHCAMHQRSRKEPYSHSLFEADHLAPEHLVKTQKTRIGKLDSQIEPTQPSILQVSVAGVTITV